MKDNSKVNYFEIKIKWNGLLTVSFLSTYFHLSVVSSESSLAKSLATSVKVPSTSFIVPDRSKRKYMSIANCAFDAVNLKKKLNL